MRGGVGSSIRRLPSVMQSTPAFRPGRLLLCVLPI